MKKVLVIIIVAIILVGGGIGAFLLLNSGEEEEPVINYNQPEENIYYSPGSYFVTNLKDTDGKGWLRVTINLGIAKDEKRNPEQLEYLTANNTVIRDTIIAYLRTKDKEQALAVDAQDIMREELMTILMDKLEIDYLYVISFDDYIVQMNK